MSLHAASSPDTPASATQTRHARMMRNRFMFTSAEAANEVAFVTRAICLGYLANRSAEERRRSLVRHRRYGVKRSGGGDYSARSANSRLFAYARRRTERHMRQPRKSLQGDRKATPRAKPRGCRVRWLESAGIARLDGLRCQNGGEVSRYVTALIAGERKVAPRPTGNRCRCTVKLVTRTRRFPAAADEGRNDPFFVNLRSRPRAGIVLQ
jgi:hypothetical protein